MSHVFEEFNCFLNLEWQFEIQIKPFISSFDFLMMITEEENFIVHLNLTIEIYDYGTGKILRYLHIKILFKYWLTRWYTTHNTKLCNENESHKISAIKWTSVCRLPNILLVYQENIRKLTSRLRECKRSQFSVTSKK